MVGILVHGDNHVLLRGPAPDCEAALAMVRRWSVVEIRMRPAVQFEGWEMSTREFREDLEWAVVVRGGAAISAAVEQLLAEMEARGIEIREYGEASDRPV